VVLVLALSLVAIPAGAQLIVDPTARADVGVTEAGAALAISEVEYDEGDIERQVLGVYGAYGVGDWFDVYGVLGLIIDAEPSDWGDSGDGFMLAVGARSALRQIDSWTFLAYGQLQYITEDYGSESASDVDGLGDPVSVSADAEGTITELILGGVARYDLNDQLSLYGGIDLIPYSDGEADVSVNVSGGGPIAGLGADDSFDFERDNMIGIRGGATYDLASFWLRAEIALLSEQTFLLGAGTTF
jgi:hypothetical protein